MYWSIHLQSGNGNCSYLLPLLQRDNDFEKPSGAQTEMFQINSSITYPGPGVIKLPASWDKSLREIAVMHTDYFRIFLLDQQGVHLAGDNVVGIWLNENIRILIELLLLNIAPWGFIDDVSAIV